MDKIEDQGSSLWQKIMEKRSSSGLEEGTQKDAPRQYRCPNCMSVLKTPTEICPHCNMSTIQAKIVPPDLEETAIHTPEKPARGGGIFGLGMDKAAKGGGIFGPPVAKQPKMEPPQPEEFDQFADPASDLNLPEAAKGLSRIRGASKRPSMLKITNPPRWLNIAIISLVVIFVIVLAVSVSLYLGWLPFKQAAPAAKPEVTVSISLTEPSVAVTTTGATVSWNSDLPSKGKLLYGTGSSYGMSIDDNNDSVIHQVIMKELEPSTTYHYALLAIDKNGNEVGRTADYTFVTESPAKKPPVVTQFEVIPGDTTAYIQWTTDVPSTSQVLYGTTPACSDFSESSPNYVTRHTIKLSNLSVNTLYYYRIKSMDSEGGTIVMDPVNMFTTLLSIPVGSKVGNKAPDFTLNVFQSQDTVSFKNYSGQKVLLTFWAVYCPECDRELYLLQSLKNKNPDMVVLAIFLESRDVDIEKTITQYKAERGDLTVPVLVDPYRTVAHMYNVDQVPCTIYIDSNGIIRDTEYGSFNLAQVEQILNSY